jgi:hypothetical protein
MRGATLRRHIHRHIGLIGVVRRLNGIVVGPCVGVVWREDYRGRWVIRTSTHKNKSNKSIQKVTIHKATSLG